MAIKDGKEVGGRPAGSKNKRTLTLETIADQALARGITPLDVMLELMRDYWERARLKHAELAPLNGEAPAEGLAEMLEYRERAGNWAKEAARYVHPTFSAVKVVAQPETPAIAGAVVPKKDAIGQKPQPKKLAAPSP